MSLLSPDHPNRQSGTSTRLQLASSRPAMGTRRLLLLAACSLVVCGSSASSLPLADGGVPAASWGFFEYTKSFVSPLSNARWGRATGVLWAEVEKPPGSGIYDWKKLDARVGSAQTARMNAIVVLKAGNGSSFSEPECFQKVESAAALGAFPNGRELSSCPIAATMESAWSRMVTELVERYDGDGDRDMPGLLGSFHLDVQVENESTNWEFWDYGQTDRTLSADRYLRLLEISYQGKQAADPDTQVILTGLFQPIRLARCDVNQECSPGTPQAVAFTKRVLGRPEIFDAVDVHLFAYYHFDPEAVDEGVQWVVDQMQQGGYQRPIYCLEWTGSNMLPVAESHGDAFMDYFPYWADFGSAEAFQAMYVALDQPGNLTYRRSFEAEQAKEFGKLFTNMLALGISRLVHVQYSDYHPGAAWNNSLWNWQGIIKHVGGVPIRKPSYYTYNILSARIFGFTGARRIEQGDGARLYEFTFPAKGPVYVLWTDQAAAVLDLSSVVAGTTLRVTRLVTELDGANAPIVQPDGTVPAAAVPAGDVPVLLEGVD